MERWRLADAAPRVRPRRALPDRTDAGLVVQLRQHRAAQPKVRGMPVTQAAQDAFEPVYSHFMSLELI